MLAIRPGTAEPPDPLATLDIGETELPAAPSGWVGVQLRAASLNRADLWALSAYADSASNARPSILGADGAGVDDDGKEVIIYPILADAGRGDGDPMRDPDLKMLGQGVDGTFAERVVVPRMNLVPKPAQLSWEAAACLGTAWLTAYRMLFGRADLTPGETVLVQGAGGGVATALIILGRASGLRVWVRSRDRERGRRAVEQLGAHAAFASGERLPEQVDAVLDTVGEATFEQSLQSLRPGGRLVVAGATGGGRASLDLTLAFRRSLTVLGSAMGSPYELARLISLCVSAKLDPVIDSVWPLREGRHAFARMRSGELFGKVVLRMD
jgi:NADPH:quinone reductase-like Zn-dependent oxidoreductase